MCSHGVWQLDKLILKYCRTSGASLGARTFIQNELPAFAVANPQIKFEVSVDPMKSPRFIGRYLDGTRKEITLKNLTPNQIQEVALKLRNVATATNRDLSKPVSTSSPSVQGIWDPSITYEGFSIRESSFSG